MGSLIRSKLYLLLSKIYFLYEYMFFKRNNRLICHNHRFVITTIFYLSLDKHGNVQRVNYNNQVRDQFPVTSLDDTHKLYKALKRFNDIAYDKTIMIKHKLQPGKMFYFLAYLWIICVDIICPVRYYRQQALSCFPYFRRMCCI